MKIWIKLLIAIFISLTITGIIIVILHKNNVSRPPITTSRPPITTSRPPITTSRPPITTSPSPVTTSRPPITTSPVTQDIKNRLNTLEPQQIIIRNKTSEDFLHVFLQLLSDRGEVDGKGKPIITYAPDLDKQWVKIAGNGKIYDPIKWGTHPQADAWNPLGAKYAKEAIIPKDEFIILSIPDKSIANQAWIIMAIKMTDPLNKSPLTTYPTWGKGIPKAVAHQQSILIEGGLDMVSDSSAVDGINFRMEYAITSDDNTIKVMTINRNPCDSLGDDYKITADADKIPLGVGCTNPAKIDCKDFTYGTKPNDSCYCVAGGNQTCGFNDCSIKLFKFDTPESKSLLNLYYGINSDGTEIVDKGNDNKVNGSPYPLVKKYINDSNNLKDNSPLSTFCKNIQAGKNDFTPYCYDYNDTNSSPYLRSPYKISLTYMDLET